MKCNGAQLMDETIFDSSWILTQMGSLADQGPVVQSIVSLTSSLRGQLVKCFTTL